MSSLQIAIKKTRNRVLRFFVKWLISKKLLIRKLIYLIVTEWDLVFVAQKESEKKFFRAKASLVKKVLNGKKLDVFEVGSPKGVEDELSKYQCLINKIVVQTAEGQPRTVEDGVSLIIQEIIGREEGTAIVNVLGKNAGRSVLEPTGSFLDYWTSGNVEKYDVIKKCSVPMTTISSVLRKAERSVDYLRLDTQGTELDVLLGLGDYRPIVIQSVISFVPLYKDQTIFFHLGRYLYELGYILFHIRYRSKGAPRLVRNQKQFNQTVLPLHGEAWFMPDWTRKKGKEIIGLRRNKYEALMLLFEMDEIAKEALVELRNS